MTNEEPRETRIIHPHPDAEQKSLGAVVVELAPSVITTAGIIAAAKIAKGKDDGKS
jgi:hypothetical protein